MPNWLRMKVESALEAKLLVFFMTKRSSWISVRIFVNLSVILARRLSVTTMGSTDPNLARSISLSPCFVPQPSKVFGGRRVSYSATR